MAPRGQRAENVVRAMSSRWEVELVALPAKTFVRGDAPVSRQSFLRRRAGSVLYSFLIDKWEPWAWSRLSRWRPRADAALLIGYPWSPVSHAARKLARRGIPYVVDTGDPWVLTKARKLPRNIATWRSKRAELRMWRGAAGAVVTTRQQGERLRRLFPRLPILVRPNGYVSTSVAPLPKGSKRDHASLRLAHFGTLSAVRIDVAPFLSELQRSQRWHTITFTQFGDDYVGMLNHVPEGIRVERRTPLPWADVAVRAAEFDAAVVFGNRLGYQLPSKAIQYLTLPIPRIAVTGENASDALAEFADVQPGWLVATPAQLDLDRRVAEHVERDWAPSELAPPRAESWPAVAAEVSSFVEQCVMDDMSARPDLETTGTPNATPAEGSG